MRAQAWRAVALGIALCAASASAQQVSGGQYLLQHMSRGLSDVQVGDWVTYRIYGGVQDRESYWRVAVVGADKDPKGRDAWWVELEMGQHPAMKAPLFQTRMLITQDAPENEPAVTRMFMAFGIEKVHEISPQSLAELFSDKEQDTRTPEEIEAAAKAPKPKPASAAAKANMIVRTLPEKRLMTLAGTVSAVPTEVRYASTVIKRIWVSREVPILHLAKLEIPAIEHSIEVRDFGRNAKPEMILPVAGSPTINLEQGWDSVLKPVELEEGASHAP